MVISTSRLPSEEAFENMSDEEIKALAKETVQSDIMRGEPGNKGFTFDQAEKLLKKAAEEDADLTDVVPDNIRRTKES